MKSSEELLREIDINEDDIDLEMSRQPAKFCYWGARYARAARTHSREKLALRELAAQIGKSYRTKMKEVDPQTRVTNDMVSTFVVNTPEYQKQERVVIEAEYQENFLNVAREAFRQRAQMILQLCRHQMDEMIQTDFTIHKNELEGRAKEHTIRTDGILGGKKTNERLISNERGTGSNHPANE